MQDSLANTWWGFVPFFALFLASGIAFVGWGRFLRGLLLPAREDTLGKLAESSFLSSLFLFGLPYLVAHLGLLNASGKALLLSGLGAGMFFCWQEQGFRELFSFMSRRRTFALILSVIFSVRLFAGYLPQGHGDPLLYHLLGPRLWVQHGSVYLDANLPNGLLASTWEYLYLWPQLLFYQGPGFAGLLEAQVICQWLHLVLGWGGSALVAAALFRRAARSDLNLEIAILAAFFVPCMQWTGGLAKNDMGIAFWALASLFFFREALESLAAGKRDYRIRALLSGIGAGLALAGKMNALFTLAPGVLVFFMYYLWESRGRSAKGASLPWKGFAAGIGLLVFGLLVGALPVYIRNYLLTGNPLFSLPLSFFPSPWISQSWSNHFSVHQLGHSAPTFDIWKSRLIEVMREGLGMPALALGLALLAIPNFRRAADPRRLKDCLLLLLVGIVGYAVLASTYAANIELRYLGGGLLLASGAGMLLVLELLGARLPERGRFALQCALVIGLLASSKLPTHLLWKLHRIAPGEDYVLSHSGGDSREWIRKNVKKGELVIVMGDNEAYYLSALDVAILTERPDTDAATYGEKDPAAFVKNLCRVSKATYLLVTREEFGFAKKFATDAYEPALVFQGAASKVYALRVMETIAGAADGERSCIAAGAPAGAKQE